MAYLEEHPPARRQFINPRRAQPTGAVVIHTAENTTDTTLPDSGAEGVAAYIANRTTPGSYHTVVDSDSIVRVGRYEWEMFHEGTGGNRWSLGLSFACRADQWPTLPDQWRQGALRNGATEAANMARWVQQTTGTTVPARRITAAQYRAGAPGFISHAELDPGRRSDPGAAFPWVEFLEFYQTTIKGDPMPTPPPNPDVEKWQRALIANGAPLTPDGQFGPITLDTSITILDHRNRLLEERVRLLATNNQLSEEGARLLEQLKQASPNDQIVADLRAALQQLLER